jgi:hypothetical protein
MNEKSTSNDEVYDEWMSYIKKRNSYYKESSIKK